ncbi:probable alpha-ketoglutarate-dependent hypophosphite dioxygenase isoform X2 [Bicyclus anynana]|uniref:Probable alpha-ketoglutarate-dependent hypophosphite dioxygenase isoform X2 n=1 Tax=Bicyclus anynana TaxID=110368 RepID=A0ABM3LYE9_BICAN|nr:probable alpha-ketoglutarate-dependent hypophosphite dioxygenase isoform X2 [Bicyclus anynana]
MVRLTREQIQFYKDNGYIHLKGLIRGKELQRVSEEYDSLFKRKNSEKTESSWVGSDDTFRESDSPYTMHHAVFGQLLYNEALLDALQDVMGTENIMLHHTKAHLKPPEKGASYPMHQDYPYFPYEKDSMVAAFIHLDAATPENGGLFVYPGSHKLGPLEDFGPKEGSHFHYVDQKKFPIEGATPVIASAGDVVIFSYLLVHGSSANHSARARRMLLAQLADASDRPRGGEPGQPGRGWMLRGVNLTRDATVANRARD